MSLPDKPQSTPCPCGSGKKLGDCCLPFLQQKALPPTAEQLMRSRYTAFVLADEGYLRYSWHPDSCPKTIHLQADTRWLGLKIISTTAGQSEDTEGTVAFVARYKNGGKATRIEENSRFVRFEGRWVYLGAQDA